MSTQVAGVLRDPFERPLGNTDIDIRAITNTFAVLPGATVKVTTSAQGEYNFILEPANYAVSVILDGRAVYQGAMTITSTTPPGTLPQLLKQAEMLSELPLNYAEYFQQVQATVKDDADRAEAAANGIGDQVDEAREYAEQSQAAAQSSQQSSQTAQQALADTQVIANKFQNLDAAVTQTQQNAQKTQADAQQTSSDKASAAASAKRAEDAANSAETVNERNLRVPTSETINAFPAAASRANNVVSFDSGGQAALTPLSSLAMLDSSGKVPLANIPASAITEVFPVSSQSDMLALNAEPGDVAIRSDTSKTYILMSSPASVLTNWKELTNDVLVQLSMATGASKVGFKSSASSSILTTAALKMEDFKSVKADFGAKGDGVSDDTVAFQNAVNSVKFVRVPEGNYNITSSINIPAGVTLMGDGAYATNINVADNVNAFVFKSGKFGGAREMAIIYQSTNNTGNCITATDASSATFDGLYIVGCYDGITIGNSQATTIHRIEIWFYKRNAIFINDNFNDVFLSNIFLNGSIYGTGSPGPQTTGIVANGKAHAMFASNIESVLSNRPFSFDGNSSTELLKPAFSFFYNCFFDSSNAECSLNGARSIKFIGCWFSTRATGIVISTSRDISFNSCQFVNNSQHGCVIQPTSKFIKFVDCTFDSNGQAASGTYSGLVLADGATDVTVIGGFMGNLGAFGTNQAFGINIAGAFCSRIIIGSVDFSGNTSAPVANSATGAEIYIQDCLGLRTRNQGNALIPSGTSSVTVPHGLGVLPDVSQIVPFFTSGPGGVTSYRIDGINATTFNILVSPAPNANISIGWRADASIRG